MQIIKLFPLLALGFLLSACQPSGGPLQGSATPSVESPPTQLPCNTVAAQATVIPNVDSLFAPVTAADCVAYVHFLMIRLATQKIYGHDMVVARLPQVAAYMQFIEARPHVQAISADREVAMDAFVALNVKYDG